MQRHNRETFFLADEGRILEIRDGEPRSRVPRAEEQLTSFRFSRLSRTEGIQVSPELREKLARAMTAGGGAANPDSSPGIPAGFTYLGQFVDHDLTQDRTRVANLGDPVSLEDMLQGRSPALDLDSLYGLGPGHPTSAAFFEADGARLKVGETIASGPPTVPAAAISHPGFDLPRAAELGTGTQADKRRPLIPDGRNDENLVVGQLHLAFMRFHNRVVDHLVEEGTTSSELFERARATVVKHYQWMLRTEFLLHIVDQGIVDQVFTYGRRFFELPPDNQGPYGLPPQSGGPYDSAQPGDRPTMPIEFSVAAYRLGHSMIRGQYEWNRVFNSRGGLIPANLGLLFRFSGTSGNLTPGSPTDLTDLDDPESGDNLRLPSNWIADFRRLFDFDAAGRKDLVVDTLDFNLTKRIDTLLVDPLSDLPAGSFNQRGQGTPPPIQRNLAFRNLTRASMVKLATGPQLVAELEGLGITPLTRTEILRGNGTDGVQFTGENVLTQPEEQELVEHTPLWFYILREAELNSQRPGRLTGLGGNIVAEVFHRAMEGSVNSIVKDPDWTPTLPSHKQGDFTMADLLLFAFEGKPELLNPLLDGPI
ncbi:heme peroxidase family protein [Streptomyces sp. NPDC058614]|uniref:peroxidase family protein n=1 Tax=Streptomyces sp. NPDC058614 TaxID=3346557 RepID=UPI00365F075E